MGDGSLKASLGAISYSYSVLWTTTTLSKSGSIQMQTMANLLKYDADVNILYAYVL